MISNYTKEARDHCFGLIDNDINAIWSDIDLMPNDTNADKWKKLLQSIARKYTFSSRFALMRILLQSADVSQLICADDPDRGFVAVLDDGTQLRFEDISIEHATSLSDSERDDYVRLLTDIAARQRDYDAEFALALIRKAFEPVSVVRKRSRTTLLTRQEAFALGHVLGLSLEEMDWFLLRVFDVGCSFSFSDSDDLIEAYGFMTGAGTSDVDALKAAYSAACEKRDTVNVCCDDKVVNWTRDVTDSLSDNVSRWKVYNTVERDEKFMEWMEERSPFLDLASLSALRVYRNLAVFTYDLATQTEISPDVDSKKRYKDEEITDFVRCFREIVQEKDYAEYTIDALFENGKISGAKCKKVAGSLLLENFNFNMTDQTDKCKAWHFVAMKTDGKMTVSGGINKSRSRVEDILKGKIRRIEKSDLLYLLWFAANLCWFDSETKVTTDVMNDRLRDFIDVAEICLAEAGLPAFYPPHLMEQCMLLSFVYAYNSCEGCEPAVVYEEICSAVPEHRVSKKNKD